MKSISKTVIFFGNEKLATGTPAPRPLIKGAVEAAGFEIEQIITGNLTELAPHEAKLAVLAAYGQLIPQSVLDQFPLGIINIHPSRLPQYRGTTPIEQAMLDGVQKTGVSIMHLTAGMDEGPIYKQKTLHLNGKESKIELTERLQQLGAELLREALSDIAAGILKPRSQSHPNRATYTRKLTKADGKLLWTKPANQLEREVRAYLGWPGSYTTLANKDIIVTKAHVTDVYEDQLDITCDDGMYLSIDELIAPSGRKMDAKAFLNGYAAA